jgi:hypothetical protein
MTTMRAKQLCLKRHRVRRLSFFAQRRQFAGGFQYPIGDWVEAPASGSCSASWNVGENP